MITRLTLRNFKRFDEAIIALGAPVVFVGPNNSGKTTALQALALWELGTRTWMEKRGKDSQAKQRGGVVLNRRDLVQLPMPTTALLWRDKHLRQAPNGGAKATQNILLQPNFRNWTGFSENFPGAVFQNPNDSDVFDPKNPRFSL